MQMRPHRPNRQAQRKRNLFIRALLLMIKNNHGPLHLAQPLQLLFYTLLKLPFLNLLGCIAAWMLQPIFPS